MWWAARLNSLRYYAHHFVRNLLFLVNFQMTLANSG